MSIITAPELAALPERTAVVDRMGDVGTVLGGMLRYPETTPQTFVRAAKKYGPFHIVYSPPMPETEKGATGTGTINDLVRGKTHPGVRVMRYVAPDDTVGFVTEDGEVFADGMALSVSDFAPDSPTPTLAQIVDAVCAYDPENGNGEVGTHGHSHDPAAGECYWAMTVGPQIAHLWANGGAS